MDPFEYSSQTPDIKPAINQVDAYDHELQSTMDDHLTVTTFEQAFFPALIILIAGALMATVIWPLVPHDLFVGWVVLFCVTLVIRFGLIREFGRRNHGNRNLANWRKLYILVAALGGTAWGVLVLFNFIIESEIMRTVVVLVALAVVAAGINSYSPIRFAYPVFVITALIPVGIWVLNQGVERYVLALMLLLYGIALLRSSVRYRLFLERSFNLARTNDQLIKDLSFSNESLMKEKTTQELLHHLAELSLKNEPLENLLLQAIESICQVPWFKVTQQGGIFLADSKKQNIQLVAPFNLSDEVKTRCNTIKSGECLCGRAFQLNKLIFADSVDHRHDIIFAGMDNHGHYNIPISRNDDVYGVLVLFLQQGHQQTDDEVVFLKSVANSLASMIERYKSQENSQIALRVIDNTSDAIVVTDPDGEIVSVNPAFSQITGYHSKEVIGKSPAILRSGHHSDAFYAELWETLNKVGNWSGEITNRRKNGSLLTVQQNISSIRDASGEIINFIGVFHDITNLKRAEEDMRQLAYFDALTGLPNRHMFEDRLQQSIDMHQKINQRLAVLFIDIRGFRTMNQSFGYSAGDDVLRATVHRLKTVVRSDDTLSRVGGDEFAVVMNHVETPETIERVMKRISQAMAKPYKIEGVDVQSYLHIGISLFPDDATDARALIDCADTALHQATSELQDQTGHRYFSGEQKKQSETRLRLESDLRHAIEKKELVLFYQPQFSLNDGVLVGAEALLRWKRGGDKLVPPNEFIPLAEQSGLIIPMTEWIVPQALTDWCKEDVEQQVLPRVAINISGIHISQPERLIQFITDTLENSHIDPGCLELEVTESSILQDIGRATETLKSIRELGVKIALDDFGTGYSSLSYLVSLPIDILKLDRMFITDIALSERSLDIVRGLIMMCHSIGIKVVAEGIENREQGELLQQIGCDIVQGFYYGRPTPIEDFKWNQHQPLNMTG